MARQHKTYFIQRGDDGPIKIGRTTDVTKRLAALSTACAEPLHVLGVMDGNHETRLHRKFAAHRIRAEWFAPVPEILEEARAASAYVPTVTQPPAPPIPMGLRREHAVSRWLPARGPDRITGTVAESIANQVIRRGLGNLCGKF